MKSFAPELPNQQMILMCNREGCTNQLYASFTSQVVESEDRAMLMFEHVRSAFDAFAAQLGWRRVNSDHFCPEDSKDLVCRRCCFRDCSCMGGPRFDAVRKDN